MQQLLGRIALLLMAAATAVVCPTVAAQVSGIGNARQTLSYNGMERSYVVRAPQVAAPGKLLPLVFVLHGGAGDAANAEAMTGFTGKAAREGFIVVYPEGSSRFRGRLLTWNAGHCCGYAMQKQVDDVGFINALLDRMLKDYPVDARRIYATGMSNGAMMSHRLGRELAHRFAAIAPVVGAVFGDEPLPAAPVAALIINGMLDKSVPYQGGAPGGRFSESWDGASVRPAQDQASYWARANGCSPAPDVQDRPALVWTRYRCPAGKSVEAYLVKDNGHAWPGGQAGSGRGDPPSTALEATDVIWAFFKANSKP
ncbi:MAG TPA: PHB depolymerase family esterase [Polaromonas sp.]|uniref:alpha/beta hydrolase family esterase n=1 Tax=Polaromonas sp. TaxID=1869339 RepID=UPI002D258D8E|nr:PHB depolymerase family esterase [Polaromonas sp.]HYW55855.1 PHB depolymerase family esterase [Polaromonas sp.]